MKNKFYNKDGSLSMYSFLCGKGETYYVGNIKVVFYLDCLWHIQAHDEKENQRVEWLSYETKTEAKKALRALLKSLKEAA